MPPAMIAYPSVQEYCDALQHPQKCFRDPDLQQSTPDVDTRGLPLPRVGGAAAVFKLVHNKSGVARAIKVFKFGTEERRRRYQAVSDHLKSFKSDYLVDFVFEEKSIRVPRGTEKFGEASWFPFLRMTWVEGLTLGKWVQQKLERNDHQAVAVFAQRFENLVQDLKTRGIAHGDLQHGNVLVVNDAPVLVDYDGMFVPALAQAPASEYGLAAFQHPLREQLKWWHPDLDDFSAWVIWLTLRAVAAKPDLWKRCDAQNADALLFRPKDFEAPNQSDLWPELRRSPDREVAERATRLMESLRHPYEIPTFDVDPFRLLRKLCAATPRDHGAIEREAVQLQQSRGLAPPTVLQPVVEEARRVGDLGRLCQAPAKDYDAIDRAAVALQRSGVALPGYLQAEVQDAAAVARLRELCHAQPKDWAALATAGDDLDTRGITPPAALQPWVVAARRVLHLRRLCTASPRDYAAIDATAGALKRANVPLTPELQREADAAALVMSFYGLCAAVPQDYDAIERAADQLQRTLGNLPPELHALLDEAREAKELEGILETLEALVRAPGDGRELIRQWLRHRLRLEALPRAAAIGRAADEWSKRIAASAAFGQVVNKPGTEAEIAAAWDRLQQAGGHPDAAPHTGRAELAKKRNACLSRLQGLPAKEEEANDRQWLLTWDDALLQGCRDADPLRQRQAGVTDRLRMLAEVQRAIEAADRGEGEEQAILDAAARLPQGYNYLAQARVQKARQRVGAERELIQALKAVPPSDNTIAAGWERLDAAQQGRLSRDQIDRCRVAVARRNCMLDLRKIPQTDDESDRHWQRTWHEDLLRDCREADPLRVINVEVAKRLAAVAALTKAVEDADRAGGGGDEKVILEAARPLPAGYRHRARTRVETARRRLSVRKALRDALQTQPVSDLALAEAWDRVDSTERARLAPTVRDRCLKAAERRDCLKQLDGISAALLAHEQDVQWRQLWNASLLASCADAKPLQPRYQLACDRLAAWKALQQCLQNKDVRTIREVTNNPLLAGYPLVTKYRTQIEDLLRQADSFDRLDRLLANDLDDLSPEDEDFLRRFPDALAAERPRVKAALQKWLNANPVRPTAARPGYVRWAWPSSSLVSHCLLAVGDLQTPEQAGGKGAAEFDKDVYELYHRGGGYHAAGARAECVTIWAVIQLDWGRVVGPPLHVRVTGR